MAYNLSELERKVLDHLSSGFTERETSGQLGISQQELSEIWLRVRDEIDGNVAESISEMDTRHAYHRVERRKMESELWASDARLMALMDTSTDAIFVINGRTGLIERVNNKALLMFDYTLRELIGQEMEMLVPDSLKRIHVAYRQGFLSSHRKRELGYHPPIVAICKDGTSLPLEIALTATAATDDVMVVCKVAPTNSQTRTWSPNFHRCLDSILETVQILTKANMCNIQRFDPNTGRLTIAAQRGFARPFLEFFADVEAESSSACGSALRAGERIIVEDVTESPIFANKPSLDILLEAGVRAVQSTPLIGNSGAVVGMISTHFRRQYRPSEADLQIIDLLGVLAAEYLESTLPEEVSV